MEVRITWEALEDGRNLPLFTPVSGPVAHPKEA
jgi:hypothetical protein